ncbi:MAG: hypothetical protein F4X20_04005 [Dehalococcoidia bacterium]|nr:hypothetical protein [Dehalococcoidia bacterium]
MTGSPPDFVAVGGPTAATAFATLTAARLGRSTGLLVADSLPAQEREALVPAGIELAFGSSLLRSEHIPWSWLDAEIVLASRFATDIDSALLGRFGRSLIGIMAGGSDTANQQPGFFTSGAGALFFAESEAESASIGAPIALSLGTENGLRLWWQERWLTIASTPETRREPGPLILAATATAFLVRLTETRNAVTASHFAAGMTALLPEAPRLSLEDIPNRDAIVAVQENS